MLRYRSLRLHGGSAAARQLGISAARQPGSNAQLLRKRSASRSVLRRCMKSKPSSLDLAGSVAPRVTTTSPLPRAATSPNGKPITLKRAAPGVKRMPVTVSLTWPEK